MGDVMYDSKYGVVWYSLVELEDEALDRPGHTFKATDYLDKHFVYNKNLLYTLPQKKCKMKCGPNVHCKMLLVPICRKPN